jgi:Transposase domain (DUF772)
LAEHGFDVLVATQCRPFYAQKMGRLSLAPSQYFRLLLLGYFEGLDSERGIAWRAAGSLGVRGFLGLALTEAAPDHSTRGELLERPNAHLYETGGMGRTHLRGQGNILKRLLVHVAACNLGLWMRTLTGIGTPHGLPGRFAAVLAICFTLWVLLRDRVTARRRRGLNLRPFAIASQCLSAMSCVM